MAEQRIYGPLELPSGKRITFRAPVGGDRVKVLQMTQIGEDNLISGAMLIDQYVQARCVQTVDGQPVDGDYKRLMDNWDNADVQFYSLVFNEMFGLNEERQEKAKEAARFLLNGATS